MLGQKIALPLEKDENWFNELVIGNGVVSHLAIQDAPLFKRLTGRTKVVNTAGYVFPSKFGNYHVCYIPPARAITLDERVRAEAQASLDALQAHMDGRYVEPGSATEVVVHKAIIFSLWAERLNALPILSVDVETTGLKHYESEIRTIGFGLSPNEAVVFEFKDVKSELAAFFEAYRGTIVMHRGAFDLTQLIHKLWMRRLDDQNGIMRGLTALQSKTHCSLILSYVVTNTCAGNELGLKPQTQAVYGNYGIEETWKAPLEEIIPYNGKDCAATLWLYHKHMAELGDLDHVFYRLNSYLREVVWMQLVGLPINQEVANRNAAILTDRQKELHDQIAAHPIVQQYMVLHREAWAARKNAKYKKKRVAPDQCDEDFNPGSHLQMQRLLYEVMGLPVIAYTDTKQPATDGDTLKALVNHTEEKDLLKAFVELSQVEKLISSFVPHFVNAPAVAGHHCLYGFYNIGGTQSGRLSCVAEWTLIKTQRGLVAITDLQQGDRVWTHQNRWRPITHLIKKPVEEMVDIQFSSGYILTCTISHKLKLPSGRWVTIEEILNERIEEVDFQPNQHSVDFGYRPSQSNHAVRSFGYAVGNNLPQRQLDTSNLSSTGRIQSPESPEILNIERRREESNEGIDTGVVSALERRDIGRTWLLDYSDQWGSSICSSSCDGSSTGIREASRNVGRTPHRRESIEQLIGQFSSSNQCRSSKDSLTDGHESGGKIQAIHYRGPLQVWDISVEEDHSYWAEGVFNHNSDSPNQQNLPSSGNDFAKYIKQMVAAPEGWLFVGADFSSLEDKIITLLTRDPNRMKVYTDGYDGHSLRAFSYFRDQMPDITDDLESINSIGKKYKKQRQDSKAPTFALTYAGTWSTLVKNCGFTEEQAKSIEARFHELYSVSDEWTAAKLSLAKDRGWTTLAFGLRLKTPVLKASVSGNARPQEAAAEERSAGNAFGQSYGLLNSRAAHAFMDRVIEAKLWNDIRPAAQIHDAQYYWVRKSVKLLKWVNDNLIPEMEWDELPELKHDQIKLGGNLIVYSPDWSTEITIRNGATYGEIGDLLNGITK
jgi:DNA polymerase I-like protein with 3'-5' exonuclease and polymerase domains